MAFQIPEYLKNYLSSAKYRVPFENFVSNANYYSQLSYQWMDYMQNVVRPCIAYSTASVDGNYNNALSTSTGMAIVKGATRLVVGDRLFFNGNDESVAFLSDIWAPQTNFTRLLNKAISFMFAGGSSVLKWNCDENGKNTLSAFRIDRTILSMAEDGEITNAVFFISILSKMKNDVESTYWLVEERKYDENGNKLIVYKVFVKSGTEKNPVLPSVYQKGVEFKNLPAQVKTELRRMGVPALNEEMLLPCKDGLGVWLLSRTAANSCIPDSWLGDPLLYGCLDLLWSIDVVYSGSLVDVLNGEGKILVPKMFLQETMQMLQQKYPGVSNDFNVTTADLQGYKDESFVYIMPSMFDKDKMSPTPVQFEIRAEQYGKMWEMYERAVCVRAGFSPTSIFPYLTPDNSSKTATEVTAEENLTRASVKDIHGLITGVINRAINEILFQEGFEADVQIQLSDYIGNKIQFDQNVRDNVTAGLLPKTEGVKRINNLTEKETTEYMDKINAEERAQFAQYGENPDVYGGGEINEDSKQTIELAGVGYRGNGNANPNLG